MARAGLSQRLEQKSKVSARDAIRNVSGVGTDLRTARLSGLASDSDEETETTREAKTAPSTTKAVDLTAQPQTFVKPAGVDEPTRPKAPTAKPVSRRDEIIQQARKETKAKRERESSEAQETSTDSGEPKKKRKKNKKSATASS
jgi:hypothetical protein